jgi:glycyl-tRNA synthetase beta chain
MTAARASLLVELQSEELPPKALKALSEAFADRIFNGLVRAQLHDRDPRGLQVFGAPRRLAVLVPEVDAVSARRPFRQKLVPAAIALAPDGSPTPALRKKLDALGLPYEPERIVRESDGRQEILIFEGVLPGVALAEALQQALDDALKHLPIPKVMSYQLADGSTTVQYVRPAHRLIALHGAEVVPVSALGLRAGRETFGHRFHCAGPLAIANADGYAGQMLQQGKVIASFEQRRARIVEQVEAAALRRRARAVMPEALVDEVTALVEWPVVYESGFDPEFLQVPPECLILTMQQNQKYFALQDPQGRLLDRFLLVSHLEIDDPRAIVAGNARVVRARLADAKFFYDQDRRHMLDSRVPALAHVVYHNRLGSQLERVERIVGIAVGVAGDLGVDVSHVERAARLAKADLVTGMVGEFPELQGVMGTYYARHDHESEDVAVAIGEHYRPRYAGDALPASMVGTCVALADKMETLAGLFGVGERPSGDRDPFALRRHALGVLRMLIEKGLPVPLPRLVGLAFDGFGSVTLARCDGEVERFLFDRLRGLLQEQGYRAHEVEAVVSLAPARIDRVPALLAAVRAFMRLPEAESLAAANKRIGNILRRADPGADGAAAPLDPALLLEPAERELARAFEHIAPRAENLLAAADYTGLLMSLAPLKEPVDRFFDDVMVMVDEPAIRANRLALLAQLRALMNRVADISLLAAG